MSDLNDRMADTGAPGPVRHSRRLSDKVLAVFHQACDEGSLDVAEALLRVLDTMLARRSQGTGQGAHQGARQGGEGSRRRDIEALVAAHERLWHLRHLDQGGH